MHLTRYAACMATITIAKTGDTFECAEGAKFLEVCQDQDAPHEFGCMIGSCTTCVCVVEKGAENVDPPSDDETDTVDMCTDVEGARLGCQLVVRGDITIRQL